MIVGILELRFQASDFGVGDYRIHFAAHHLRCGRVELGLGLRDAGHSRGGTVPQAIDFFTGQGERGSSALQRDFVGARIDDKKNIAFLDQLVVAYVKLDDVTVDLRSNSHKIGAYCSSSVCGLISHWTNVTTT